jgi:hypothetical protein
MELRFWINQINKIKIPPLIKFLKSNMSKKRNYQIMNMGRTETVKCWMEGTSLNRAIGWETIDMRVSSKVCSL